MQLRSTVLAFVTASSLVEAHPGEHLNELKIKREQAVRQENAEIQQRALAKCRNSPAVKARRKQAIQRRSETLKRLREERGLEDLNHVHRRTTADFAKWSGLSHNKTGTLSYDVETSPTEIFGTNASCIFAVDNADGPYFVQGELLRSDVAEDQPGVPVRLDMQYIDVETCLPADLIIDIWSCNATGVYSGVSVAGQGGLNSTYLRGVQKTDEDGVVTFDTTFPGHYEGRANHQHVIAHVGAEVLANGSYTGGHVAHLSQFFYDQALVDAIEVLEPYNTNAIPRTSNAADWFTGYSASAAYDPFLEYVMLGNTLYDGLLVWAELGINMSASWDDYALPASFWTEDGGVDNPDFVLSPVVGTPPPTHG